MSCWSHNIYIYIYTHTTDMYRYIRMCVCVCARSWHRLEDKADAEGRSLMHQERGVSLANFVRAPRFLFLRVP